MFTDADHAKAVELYKAYKDAEWWPKVNYNSPHDQWTTDFKIEFQLDLRMAQHHALSAIAWAMANKADFIQESHKHGTGELVYYCEIDAAEGEGPTRFLALAAAIEDQK